MEALGTNYKPVFKEQKNLEYFLRYCNFYKVSNKNKWKENF